MQKATWYDDMDSPPSDLNSKYQKIATEYAKLKAQVAVLRKALLEEQSKSREVQDDLRERDQAARKSQQETESLTFRNHQLTKRVEHLQEELDNLQNQRKKTKRRGSEDLLSNGNSNPVIGEELQKKIVETAQLHEMIAEQESKYSQELEELKRKLSSLEKNQNQCDEKHSALVDKLQSDKAHLELRLETQSQELWDSKRQQEQLERQVQNTQEQLHKSNKLIRQRLPFVDSRLPELNCLNVPPFDRSHQQRIRSLFNRLSGPVGDLVSALCDFYTYCEQRADCDTCIQSVTKHHLCRLLHENANVIRPLNDAYASLQDQVCKGKVLILSSLAQFSQRFSAYTKFFHKLLPYYLLSLSEESSASWCTDSLERKNKELQRSVDKLYSAVSVIDTYLQLLSTQAGHSCQVRLIKELCAGVSNLHRCFRDLSRIYTSKMKLQQDLPTVSAKQKTTDGCILNSLVSLVTANGKISTEISENLNFLRPEPDSEDRTGEGQYGAHPVVNSFLCRGAAFLSSIDEKDSATIPYEEALKNQVLLDHRDKSEENLRRQLENVEQKIEALEQDREHWRLEYHLLAARAQKHKLDLESPTDDDDSKPTSITEEPSPIAMLSVSGEETEPDNELKKYFKARVETILQESQVQDGKNIALEQECKTLRKRLEISEKTSISMQEEISMCCEKIMRREEEMVSTTENYTRQLSAMSDHLANMNDMLATKDDQIQNLKSQMATKGTRKGKLF